MEIPEKILRAYWYWSDKQMDPCEPGLCEKLIQLEESFRQRNIQLLFPGDEDYPLTARDHVEHKPIFCVQGTIPKNLPCFTVVGRRTPSVESIRWMKHEFALFLKKRKDVVIVSGAARGVDQEAHELALIHKVPTLAFLPCGIDYTYPDSFQMMREKIIAGGGAVISGFAPWEKMQKAFFHQRNRWMVEMSDLVIVVEAQKGGGSLLTGRFALECQKEVRTLPVHPSSSWGLGNNDLLAEGGYVLRDWMDLDSLLFSKAKGVSYNKK